MLETDVALVTGASGAIGSEIVKMLASHQVTVVAIARNRTRLEECFRDSPSEFRERIQIANLDVSNFDQVTKLIASVTKALGRIDILINGAGVYGEIGPVAEVAPNDWRRAFDVNVMGTYHCCHSVLPTMLAAGCGHIINLAGGGATGPMECLSSYGASKAAIVRLTDSLANEVREHNIQVNAILPGLVDSPMQDALLAAGERAGPSFSKIRALRDRGEGGVSPGLAAQLTNFLIFGNGTKLTGKLLSARYDRFQEWTSEQINFIGATPLYSLCRLDFSTVEQIKSRPSRDF